MGKRIQQTGSGRGFCWDLGHDHYRGAAWQLLREILGIELLSVIIVAGLVITGISVWYTRDRKHKKWVEENRDLIEGRNRRNRRTKSDES